jgi:hypothetical protein
VIYVSMGASWSMNVLIQDCLVLFVYGGKALRWPYDGGFHAIVRGLG